MEAMSPWDRVWLDHTNLTHKRILVADNAVSAYKIDVMCTMMAGYDMVHGGVSESSTDEASRLWEEERISFRTSLFPTGQRRRPGKWPRGKYASLTKSSSFLRGRLKRLNSSSAMSLPGLWTPKRRPQKRRNFFLLLTRR
ncbi:hypothetical protein MtrunA17_Chr1g0175621 [Medicago truncatula]|uniref:Uncharacterized protein n=1 Tax=Medicago truncatula TaxID=3880 RepID=A0A396JRB2_MEDTR|nr:hypothetical protein MtrunA17_Chr1g0175621 [Medicago truncatula]